MLNSKCNKNNCIKNETRRGKSCISWVHCRLSLNTAQANMLISGQNAWKQETCELDNKLSNVCLRKFQTYYYSTKVGKTSYLCLFLPNQVSSKISPHTEDLPKRENNGKKNKRQRRVHVMGCKSRSRWNFWCLVTSHQAFLHPWTLPWNELARRNCLNSIFHKKIVLRGSFTHKNARNIPFLLSFHCFNSILL